MSSIRYTFSLLYAFPKYFHKIFNYGPSVVFVFIDLSITAVGIDFHCFHNIATLNELIFTIAMEIFLHVVGDITPSPERRKGQYLIITVTSSVEIKFENTIILMPLVVHLVA